MIIRRIIHLGRQHLPLSVFTKTQTQNVENSVYLLLCEKQKALAEGEMGCFFFGENKSQQCCPWGSGIVLGQIVQEMSKLVLIVIRDRRRLTRSCIGGGGRCESGRVGGPQGWGTVTLAGEEVRSKKATLWPPSALRPHQVL